jgi:hypothetical protein
MQKHATGAAGRAASPVWNHGYKIGPKRALKPKEVSAIRFELGRRDNPVPLRRGPRSGYLEASGCLVGGPVPGELAVEA